MNKRKMRPIVYLIIGIIILIVPTTIYLCFLIPKLQTEYTILMASGGIIGGSGMFGSSMIPDKTRYGAIFKTASKSFTLLVVVTLVREFIKPLIGLAAVLIVSYIIFLIFKELWKNARRVKENGNLAEEIARGITETIK